MGNKHKQFNAFDKVLVKAFNGKWKCSFYSHWDEDFGKHITTANVSYHDYETLPYEGNEHLVGTRQESEEEIELKEGEWIMCASGIYNDASEWVLRQFALTRETVFLVVNGGYWSYAVCFKNFNPEDMKETKKHILCVKNGKVVRYKGRLWI